MGSEPQRFDVIVFLRGWPGPLLPLIGSLIVRLGRIGGPLELGDLSLLVQIRPSYQLHAEGQASPVRGLCVPPQPLVRVLAEHAGGSGRRNRSPGFPGTRHTPAGRPGTCSTPRARAPCGRSSARPGRPPAQREPDSASCIQHPRGAARLGPGRAEGGRGRGQGPGRPQVPRRCRGARSEGITWATRRKRLREAWRCWFCSVLRQETRRACGRAAGKAEAAQDFVPGPKSPLPHHRQISRNF